MNQQEKQNHLPQQLSTEAEKNNIGQSIVNEKNILELIYQNKFNNIKNCIIPTELAEKYNSIVDTNKDSIEKLSSNIDTTIDQDLFDQNNRLNWFMPDEYNQLDIEKYVLGLCKTPTETERVQQEMILYKSHAMMDVLQFLKYMVDTLRKNNIVWGVGRGSSVASYVLYLLGVHKVDSIKYNLDPTEFLR